ncbi:hypothetical protein M422DRAFT_274011 [Sphaerobolus stellatus SS14]|uniref:Uncharacterized protein n=1 Tax=Sphaerobolus stellatus (strain SS14) TaxID=990650 RepID=A0A0C9UI40_SPHS4|nr:hypothetical protein M422DRAFT_274011 [Sphaerobolus stellatus SS14]
MDNEPNTHMQVDPSTNPMSAIQAFKLDPSNEWVIESVPGFVTIKHKLGCSICDASASHCMATKWSYEICLTEKDVSHAVAEAWPELVRYQDDYYRLLEDHNILKESLKSAKALAEERRAKTSQLYDRLDSRRVTIQNLTDQVQSLEKELQEAKDNPAKLSRNEDLILENKRLKRELDYYNGYRLSDIPVSDVVPPNSHAPTTSKKSRNNSQVVREADIPAIGGYHPSPKHKRIIADPPPSITGVLPKPLGKSRAEQWDQPAFRGASEWILEQDVHDVEMQRLYAEAKALPPHQRTPDHTVVMLCIDEYTQLLANLVAHHDDPDWMTDVIQSFNSNPSGVPRNLQLEGLHVNVDDTKVWYWVNLIKPKFRGAEAESLLQLIFSSIGRWEKLVAGRWKRNDSLFLCSPTLARYEIPCHQKLDTSQFAYWLGCNAGGQRDCLVGVAMNHFCVHDDLLPLVQGSSFYSPPTVGEPMDQDELDPEPIPIQHIGSSSLADRLDYGEGGSFSQPPADARELWACISYFDSFVPQGTVGASMAELSEELMRELYTDNHE